MLSMGMKSHVCKIERSRDLMYNIVLIVNNTGLHTKNFDQRVNLMLCVVFLFFYNHNHKKRKYTERLIVKDHFTIYV